MPISYKAIGRNIRSARKSAGFTQQAAAEHLGISTLHYGRLERGERALSLSQAADISVLFRVPLFNLLDGMAQDVALTSVTLDSRKIGTIIDFLAAGCSDDARAMMIDACTLIAQRDKYAAL